jgi:hypothetical protein
VGVLAAGEMTDVFSTGVVVVTISIRSAATGIAQRILARVVNARSRGAAGVGSAIFSGDAAVWNEFDAAKVRRKVACVFGHADICRTICVAGRLPRFVA